MFLLEEAKYMLVYMIFFGGIMYFLIDRQLSGGKPYATIAFVVGATASLAAGWIGMQTAVMCNVRCAYECWVGGLPRGYAVAVRGGSVMGMALVSLGTLTLYGLIVAYRAAEGTEAEKQTAIFEAIAGFGLGGSSIALFARVGGGIYTKAADVGADLAGKNEWGLDEDDPRNPACIADNVGDNVGDVAGMGADLFGSFAESTCAALVLASSSPALAASWASVMYPMLISSVGIVVGVLTLIVCGCFYPVQQLPDVEKALK